MVPVLQLPLSTRIRLEIYDSNGQRHLVRGPRFHEPLYTLHGDEEGNSWLSMDSESIEGYVDGGLAVTDKLIFALYSGMSRGDVRKQRWWSPPAKTVFVFNWEGRPLAALELEDGALHIGVSEDGRSLYAIYRRPTPMILQYSVPDLSG